MKYPKDRFDDIPTTLDRRGAHRAPRTRGDRIASWLWGLGAVVVLVGLGLGAMLLIDNVVSFEADPSPTPTETAPVETEAPPVAPQQDPNIPVTVLNGTDLPGVAGNTGDKLQGLGWNVVNRDDADVDTYTTSSVIYGAADDEAAALAVAEALGGGTVTLDPAQAQPGTITVIIGTDLAGA